MQWLRDEVGLIKNSKEIEKYALKVKDTNGVYLVPALWSQASPFHTPFCNCEE